jgi:hypothetical protein
MLLSEMLGVERGEKFMVDGMCGEYRVGLFCEKYEKLLTIDSFGDWIPAKDGLLCVVIDRAPSGIIHLPTPLTDEQREQLKAIWTLGGRWLAKDGIGNVFAYDSKPQKIMNCSHWNNDEDYECFTVMRELSVCAIISWSDPEPFDIGKVLGIKN